MNLITTQAIQSVVTVYGIPVDLSYSLVKDTMPMNIQTRIQRVSSAARKGTTVTTAAVVNNPQPCAGIEKCATCVISDWQPLTLELFNGISGLDTVARLYSESWVEHTNDKPEPLLCPCWRLPPKKKLGNLGPPAFHTPSLSWWCMLDFVMVVIGGWFGWKILLGLGFM